jgi:hypothetical protein
MDSNKLKLIIIAVLAIFAALYLGITAATAQIETVLWVGGGLGLITCTLLGKRIWMLLPFLGTLNLGLMIPGQPSTMLVAQALFVGFCALLFLMRKLPFQIAFTELGFWTLLLSLCVLQAYIRNPVGLDIFGSGSVGAKPYAIFIATMVCSVILSTLQIPAPDLRWIIRLSIVGGIANFFILALGFFVPSVGMWIGSVNPEATNQGTQQEEAYGVERASRIFFVRDIAKNLSLWICSFVSPIRACFHPIWAPLVLLSFAFAAFSGYRMDIGTVGIIYLVGIAYRGGGSSLALSFFALVSGIILLAFINVAAPLPVNIQRSLSFLPGTWDKAMLKETEDSTEWRVEMWKEALLTDFWIKDKLFGDGLGMTRQEYNYMQSFETEQTGGAVGSGKLTKQQEFMMVSGSYHSGPVSTIRATGYFGLLVLLLAQIRLAVHAHRQIQRARNTEWFPLALFIGISSIHTPFVFVFIFGTFGSAIAAFLMGSAMVRVLENNLPLPVYVHKRAKSHVPLAMAGRAETRQGRALSNH